MPLPTDPAELADALRRGDRRALARAISIVEDGRSGADDIVAACYPHAGAASVVGITGSPGAGKSTLTDRLIALLRTRGRQVGVVAVDPSSPFTGGSILGDRIRMQAHVSDPGVYVRSMSSRGHLGGLADATSRVLVLLGAAGFDPILVETVGVGQSEVEVVGTADTTLVVVTPGWGDGVQAAKAGVLEIGDVFVVNKADLPGADEVARDLVQMLELSPSGSAWSPPVVSCSAADGSGVEDVWEAVEQHHAHLLSDDRLREARRHRAEAELRRAVTARLARHVAAAAMDPAIVDAVAERRIDPWSAAASVPVD